MTDQTKVEAQAAAEAPAKVVEAVADTVEKISKEAGKVAKRTRAATARRVKREVKAEKVAPRRSNRKNRIAARKTVRVAKERIETVTNNNFFNGFEAVPAFAPLQTIFAEANERSQELVKRSQKIAEELADLTRANVEAVVEASRVAAEGAR